MKKILIIANFNSLPWEKGNGRFSYIANMLANNKENEVELVTSSFYHGNKRQREMISSELEKLNYKVQLLCEPGYNKNISLKRFYSHYILSRNLKKYLKKKEDKPDVIYCAVPSLDVAKQAAKYTKKNKIKFIVDIQDLWPEAFKMVFDIPVISDMILYPIKCEADYIYAQADEIIAVSETYLNRACLVSKKYKNKVSVFLGTDLDDFDKYKKKSEITKSDDRKIQLVYIGTLGNSYDICSVIDALEILNNKKNYCKLLIMGDGPLKDKFQNYAMQKKVDVEFTGKLKYEDMVQRLCECDIAINPIKGKSAGSIINKVGDYAAAGLPVINTQESKEYREIVDEYKIGYNCINGDSNDMAIKIKNLIEDKKMLEYGKNNRKFAEEKFDRKKTYIDIENIVIGE